MFKKTFRKFSKKYFENSKIYIWKIFEKNLMVVVLWSSRQLMLKIRVDLVMDLDLYLGPDLCLTIPGFKKE